jgi:hypothetical protein
MPKAPCVASERKSRSEVKLPRRGRLAAEIAKIEPPGRSLSLLGEHIDSRPNIMKILGNSGARN